MTLSTPTRRARPAPSEAGIRGPGLGGLHLLAQDRPQDARTDQQADRRHQAGSIHRYRQTRTAQVPPARSLVTTDRRRAPPRLHRHPSRDHHSRSPLSLLTSPHDPARGAADISSPLWGVSHVALRAFELRGGRAILSGVYDAAEATRPT